jgi:thiol-disulfide isomerase/thioredoxin
MKKPVVFGIAAVAALIALFSWLYLTNTPPPVPSLSDTEAAIPTKPYVIKLHAQWCPVCMATKGIWSQIEAAYGTRVNLVVFDFTDDATTAKGKAEAARLGLQQFFDENSGWTGTIAVLSAAGKKELATIHGSRDFAEYRAAIDSALGVASP